MADVQHRMKYASQHDQGRRIAVRLIVALLTCVTLGGISLALANDPDPTPQPPAATQSEKSSTPRADQTTTTANATPPSASTAVAPADKAVTASSAVPGTAPAQSPELPELAAEEKNLIAHGYRLEVRNGENYFCHAEAMVGTRFKSKACGTAQQLAATRRNSKDVLERAQRPGSDHPAK
jgi:cytoskeletal protein RodZ